MANELGSIVVKLGLDAGGLSGGLAAATSKLASFAAGVPGMLGPVATIGIAVGAAIVGIGIASVAAAGDFQQAGTLLVTSAGESAKNIEMVKQGILQMAVDTGTSTDMLMKGMFNIESAGFRGRDALQVESAAARGARVENSDLVATTDVLTTAMHNYHLGASKAVDVMNSFRMAAAAGKMHMDDLTGALKNVLPIASMAGVQLTDVEAALSTMSNAGDKGAAAGTHLSQMLTYLLAPSKKATGVLTEVGLTTQKIADEMKVSLPGAVEMITDAVGKKFPVGSAKYIAALSAIVGGNKSMKAMLELSGISLKEFVGDASALAPTMKSASTSIDGFAAVQENFNFKMDQAKAAIETTSIRIGTLLLPVLSRMLDGVLPLIAGFGKWATSSNGLSGIFTALGPVLGRVIDFGAKLVASFTEWETKTHGVAKAIGAVGQGFNSLGTFVSQAVLLFKGVADSFQTTQNACQQLSPAVREIHFILSAIGGFLAATFIPVWQQLVETFNTQLKPAWTELVTAITPLLPALANVGKLVLGVVVVVLVLLVGVLAGVIKAFAGLLSGVIVAFGGIIKIISGALQIISGVMAFFADLFTGKWNKLGGDIMVIVGGWGRVFSGIWDVIRGVFMAGIGVVVGFVTGFLGTVIGIFTHLADVLVGHSIIPDMINAIIDWFLQLGPRALSAVQGMVGLVTSELQNFASAAAQLGSNIIQGLANGITNAVGFVTSAIGNVVSIIDAHLPHSPAKRGPLAQLGSYGPSLVKGIAQGIDTASPMLALSMTHLVQPAGSYPIRAAQAYTSSPAAGSGTVTNGGRGGDIHTHVYLDGQEIMHTVMTSADAYQRLKNGNRSTRAA